MARKKFKKLSQTQRLLEVVHDLRTQCPWDRKQTHKSLSRYLLEEAYETVEAISSRKKGVLREELGDVLLQVALHAEIASETDEFDFEEVAKYIADKMINRHPHIYQKTKVLDYKSHMKNWTALKQKEKPKRLLLEGTPKAMPALQLAQRYGEIAGTVGFDWDDLGGVLEKLEEELKELRVELKKKSKDGIEEELGDVLFTLASIARHTGIDAESALKVSTKKFHDRFTALEKMKRKEKKELGDCTHEELEAAWNQIKTDSI